MVRMKCWKRFCAAALALSLPVMALAEAKLEDTQTFARSITLGRASDTYVTREDWRDTLRAMDGTLRGYQRAGERAVLRSRQ